MTPDTVPEAITQARFWSNVDRRTTYECWPWTGPRNHKDYGHFYLNKRGMGAHRASYILTHGGIEDGKHIDHLCRNHCCVNPRHLEAVAPIINLLRGKSYPTHCCHGHPYSRENTIFRGIGLQRVCRQCQNDKAARYKARLREKRNG